MNGEATPKAATETKAKLVAKTTESKIATKKADQGNADGGKTPKALWREKLAGKGQRPPSFSSMLYRE